MLIKKILSVLIIMTVINSALSKNENLIQFSECQSDKTKVTIFTKEPSKYKVEKRLFGKFTENLGNNVYNGFWAQILTNPSLEPINVCLNAKSYNQFDKASFKRMTHQDIIKDADLKNMAYYWFKWNGNDVKYKLSTDAYNTSNSQVLNVKKFNREMLGIGIRQPVYMPIHRENKYNLSFFVKKTNAPIIAAVTDISGKKVLAKTIFPPQKKNEWVKIEGVLKLSGAKKLSGKALWFCIGLQGNGTLQIDQITLFPNDAIDGFDPEVVKLLKDEHISILRFPGGNYVSGYHWKDDLVPFDKRATTRNCAWHQYDPHHVGTDEHIKLCRLINAEPMICVNAGNGTPQEAADWIEYCNGSVNTKWGKIRAERGYPEPYNVKVWEIGNELWGPWQIGNCTSAEYAKRYRKFYNAMRVVDPSTYLIATGNPSSFEPDWNDVLINECSDILHSLTLHFLCSNNNLSPPELPYLSQMGYSYFFEKEFFRRLHELGKKKGLDLKIALTEEMIFCHMAYQPRPEMLAEALFYAGTLNSAIRTEGIVDIFTHSAILNHGGNMTKEKGKVYPNPIYYALQELQKYAGSNPVRCEIETPFAEIPESMDWLNYEARKFPLIDIMPLVKEDKLNIIIINRSAKENIKISFKIDGEKYKSKFRMFELTGDSFMAMNDFQNPDRVKPKEKTMKVRSATDFTFNASPAALYVISFDKKK